MTVRSRSEQDRITGAVETLESKLQEARRSALAPYVEAVATDHLARGCAGCDAWCVQDREIEAAAEYWRGVIRGIETAIETLQAAQAETYRTSDSGDRWTRGQH